MHTESITLDRIFDVQQREGGRASRRFTEFSFEAGGRKHYGVRAPGWPVTEPGHRLTVLLRSTGNWQTLAGWVNHSTGELVLPHAGKSLAGLFQGLVMALFAFPFHAHATTATGRGFALAWGAFCLFFSSVLATQWWRERAEVRVLKKIKRDTPPPH